MKTNEVSSIQKVAGSDDGGSSGGNRPMSGTVLASGKTQEHVQKEAKADVGDRA